MKSCGGKRRSRRAPRPDRLSTRPNLLGMPPPVMCPTPRSGNAGIDQREDRRCAQKRRSQGDFAPTPSIDGGHVVPRGPVGRLQDGSHEGKAVAAETGAAHGDDDIARGDLPAIDGRAAVARHADGGGAPVEVHARAPAAHAAAEFGDFAADDRDAALGAGRVEALHELVHDLLVGLVHVEDVDEIDRLDAVGDEVVGHHGDEVVAQGGIDAGAFGHFGLGADAVAGHRDLQGAEIHPIGEGAGAAEQRQPQFALPVLEAALRPTEGPPGTPVPEP